MNQQFRTRWTFVAALSFLFFTTACSNSSSPGMGELAARRLKQYAQEITSEAASLALKPGQKIVTPITVKNTGSDVWPAGGPTAVRFGYQWFVNGKLLALETPRTVLPFDLPPGALQPLSATVIAPTTPGQYTLKFTMVQEGVTWFSDAGAKTCDIQVTVQ